MAEEKAPLLDPTIVLVMSKLEDFEARKIPGKHAVTQSDRVILANGKFEEM